MTSAPAPAVGHETAVTRMGTATVSIAAAAPSGSVPVASAATEQQHPSEAGSPAPAPAPAPAPTAGSASASASAQPQPQQEEEEEEKEAGSYEQRHVHAVYDDIAAHFAATRQRPWPVVADFVRARPAGAIGLDVGCGSGRYLGLNGDVFVMGADRSASLARLARDGVAGAGAGWRPVDVAVADGLALPYRRGAADFAICVAVIHHLSTRERRRAAVAALLDCVRSADEGGLVLLYVWALEQRDSRRGWDEGAAQDQLVPWVTRKKAAAEGDGGGGRETTYLRYYHLYRKGELEEDVVAVEGRVVSAGYDKDNWWVIASRPG